MFLCHTETWLLSFYKNVIIITTTTGVLKMVSHANAKILSLVKKWKKHKLWDGSEEQPSGGRLSEIAANGKHVGEQTLGLDFFTLMLFVEIRFY